METNLIPTTIAASMLDRSPKTVLGLVKAGRIPFAMKGPGLRGAYFFDRSEIARLAVERGRSL